MRGVTHPHDAGGDGRRHTAAAVPPYRTAVPPYRTAVPLYRIPVPSLPRVESDQTIGFWYVRKTSVTFEIAPTYFLGSMETNRSNRLACIERSIARTGRTATA